MSKRNKSLIALLLVLCVGLVGVTIAYFSNSTSIENEFQTKEYGTTYTESFVSPDNWLPGDTTNKTVIVTNSGQVDEAVRISLSETWTPNNSNATLNGWIHADGTKSNHTTENELSTDVRAAIINFTNNSDWTKVGDYYYYNYRLAPGQTTDSLIESVTFNALTKLGDTCITSSENGIKTITCNSSGEDYDHATYKLTVNVETVQYNKYQEAWNTNVNISSMKPMNASQLALKSNPISVTNYTDGNVHEMYTFNHEATDQIPTLTTDYRYIGDDPYNYVYFNCDSLDNQNSENCEVWRIIGVFDVERPDPNDNTQTITERRMKLVRGSALPVAKQWDTRNSEQYSSGNYGKNEWVGSTIQTYLNDNGEYYTRTGTASTYGLKTTAKNMISDAKYYLGGGKYNNNTPNGYGTAEGLYYWERGIEVFSQENLCLNNPGWDQCSINYCNNNPSDEICNATRSPSWNGKVSLMYSSDIYMTYVNGIDNVCYNKPHECYIYYDGNPSLSWIHNSNIIQGEENPSYIWLISPKSDDSNHVFGSGSVLGTYSGSNLYGVRPTLYLSSSVKIIDGDGSINNPYWLGL